jgi:hypothetical protein
VSEQQGPSLSCLFSYPFYLSSYHCLSPAFLLATSSFHLSFSSFRLLSPSLSQPLFSFSQSTEGYPRCRVGFDLVGVVVVAIIVIAIVAIVTVVSVKHCFVRFGKRLELQLRIGH